MLAAGLAIAFACAAIYFGLAFRGARAAHLAAAIQAERSAIELRATQTTLADATRDLAELRVKAEAAAKRTPSVECAEMLRDMVVGGTLLRVERIDQNDVFLMSPRTSR